MTVFDLMYSFHGKNKIIIHDTKTDKSVSFDTHREAIDNCAFFKVKKWYIENDQINIDVV